VDDVEMRRLAVTVDQGVERDYLLARLLGDAENTCPP